jgi:hypothetical protein
MRATQTSNLDRVVISQLHVFTGCLSVKYLTILRPPSNLLFCNSTEACQGDQFFLEGVVDSVRGSSMRGPYLVLVPSNVACPDHLQFALWQRGNALIAEFVSDPSDLWATATGPLLLLAAGKIESRGWSLTALQPDSFAYG